MPGLGALPGEFEKTFGILLNKNAAGRPEVIISEHSDPGVYDFMRFHLGGAPKLTWVDPGEFNRLQSNRDDSVTTAPRIESDSTSGSAVVRDIERIIATGIEDEASDIHFEPGEDALLCRTRIDGSLVEKQRLGKERIPEIISRLKIMSRLDIAEKRRPQDGRIRFDHKGRTVDIRVSVIPTDFGEKVVLRLLDKQTLRLDLNALGFNPQQLTEFRRQIELPNGIILVTGPTGSGKTTTLYAALNYLRRPDVNISTVEDPIEYNLKGINQTQIRPEINVTFATMLRSLLRQDPDIIMVGEIRDRETLDIALRASMTGHLVLSTLHTNSAVSTIPRLIDMGAEAFLLSSSIRMIVAQRLLRKCCQDCFIAELTESEKAAASTLPVELEKAAGHSVGCVKCNWSGFRGRTAVYEVLPVSEAIREAILTCQSESAILRIARAEGLNTMVEQAQGLINSGLTTPSEVIREATV